MGNLVRVIPVIDHSVRTLCFKSYHGHPKGCPNFGERETCPPEAPFLEDVIDLGHPVYAVFNIYPYGKHTKKMCKKHPEWTERQRANCLYWQGTARKQLRARIAKALEGYDDGAWVVLDCPEACGVNVTATMKAVGHELEWPPKTVTYQVALIGRPLGGQR